MQGVVAAETMPLALILHRLAVLVVVDMALNTAVLALRQVLLIQAAVAEEDQTEKQVLQVALAL
jgi:hypothetical protein